MMTKNGLIGAVLMALICGGCMANEVPSRDKFPIVVAIEKSVLYANEDRVDLANFSVVSVELGVNAWSAVFDRNSKDPYDVEVVQKLKGKEYWEVCYSAYSPGLVGATYCYYLERSSYKLLAAYRMK